MVIYVIHDVICNPTAAKMGIGFVSAVNQEGGLVKTARWFKESSFAAFLLSDIA